MNPSAEPTRQLPDDPTKLYWMGRDLDTLDRAELMEVIRFALAEADAARAATQRISDLLRKRNHNPKTSNTPAEGGAQ